jgi:hypothetical protein
VPGIEPGHPDLYPKDKIGASELNGLISILKVLCSNLGSTMDCPDILHGFIQVKEDFFQILSNSSIILVAASKYSG